MFQFPNMGRISSGSLAIILWILSLITNVIGWYIAASRNKEKDTQARLKNLESSRERLMGWIKGKFKVDLNGGD